MAVEINEPIRAILVTAGRHSIAEALGTVRSIETTGTDARPVVLATEPVAEVFAAYDLLSPAVVLPNGYAALEILEDEDLLAFAEPFALEWLVEHNGAVATVTPGALVVGRLAALEEALAGRPMALTAPAVLPPSDTSVPHLTLRDPTEALSTVAVGVTVGAIPGLRVWQQTMIDSLFDPNQAPPAPLRDGVLASLLGHPAVTVEGVGTVVHWSDWAAEVSRGTPVDDAPPIVDAAEMWGMLGVAEERVDGEMTETEYRLVDLRVHDSKPLQPLIEVMTSTLADVGECPSTTPFERITRAVRRASDPTGSRWPAGTTAGFEAWLYEKDPRGVTRIADLHWYAEPEMGERFPHARSDPSEYLLWCRENGPRILGFDLLDPTMTPVVPLLHDESGGQSGWKNAAAWRWNVIKGLVPGVAAAGERRIQGLDAVSGPEAGRGIAPPRRLEVDRAPALWGPSPRSLSLIGCVRAESGLGQASRASLRAIESLDIPFSYIDTSEKYPSRSSADVDLSHSVFGATGDVNLIHANANEMIKMNDTVLRHRVGGRFNAAMWFWEAGHLPAWKLAAFDRIDELWVATSYLVDVLGQYGRVPVHNIGLATPLPADRVVDREVFDFDEDEFVFLFVYDAFSSHGRKNPELTLQAFFEAFGPDFDGVRFVMKVSNLNKLPVDRERLMSLAETTEAVTIIDRYVDHETVYDLMAAADVYVSLHAAEGYGLTILESMSLGTPAICTGYSGNMDFTTVENSWLVDYELIRTEQLAGPYPPGSTWAKPDLDSVVDSMRHVVSHPEEVAHKAVAARRDARETASLDRYAANLGEQLRRVL